MSLLCLTQTLAYVPFRDPLWGGWNYWPLFLLPLCVLIAVAYKGVRVPEVKDLPAVASRWALLLLGSLVGVALLLYVVMRVIQL
jgi:hypothetical protein